MATRALPARCWALGLLLALPAWAQEGAPVPAGPASAVTLASGDREVTVDLGAGTRTPEQVREGLFPEEALSPEARAIMERCERMQAEGFRCAKPVLTYTRFLFPGVSFSWASAELPDLMKQQLKAFAEALRGRNGQKAASVIRIEGHADATGDAATNKVLSEKRAEAVRDYLGSLGVDKRLFRVEGRGASALRNAQEPAAAENRRVEIARTPNAP
jgi:outer membrane protein OmpA-like peptidoglycan-associated protein